MHSRLFSLAPYRTTRVRVRLSRRRLRHTLRNIAPACCKGGRYEEFYGIGRHAGRNVVSTALDRATSASDDGHLSQTASDRHTSWGSDRRTTFDDLQSSLQSTR